MKVLLSQLVIVLAALFAVALSLLLGVSPLVVVLIGLTVLMAGVRRSVSGWYFVVTGLMALACAFLWTPSLSTHDTARGVYPVMRDIKGAVGWFFGAITPPDLDAVIDRGLQAVAASWVGELLAPISNVLTAALGRDPSLWSGREEGVLGPILILACYLLVSRLVIYPLFCLVLEYYINEKILAGKGERAAGLSAAWRWCSVLFGGRAGNIAAPITVADALDDLNSHLSRSIGSHAACLMLGLAVLILLVSYASGHWADVEVLGWSGAVVDPFAAHRPIFWIGVYIFCIELLAQLALLRIVSWWTPMETPTPVAQAATQTSLAPLFLASLRQHANHILHYQPADAPSAPVPAPAAAKGPREVRNEPFVIQEIRRICTPYMPPREEVSEDVLRDVQAPDRDLLIDEPLHPGHLGLIFALCEQRQSLGQITLIICPERLLEYVSDRLRTFASQSMAGMMQRGVVLHRSDFHGKAHEPFMKGRSYSYLLVADADVGQALLSESSDAQYLLTHLGMIVAIEVQDQQVALLRMQLPRLWLRVDRRRVRCIVQVGNVRNEAVIAHELFPLPGREGFATLRPAFARGVRCHRLIWRDERPASASVVRGATSEDVSDPWPMSLSLVLLASAAHERTRMEDPAGPVDKDAVRRAEKSVSRWRERSDTLAINVDPERVGVVAGDRDARVVILEARGSVQAALDECVDRFGHGEVLVNVVAHDYPLRDYHLALVRGIADKGNDAKRGTPFAPVPGGGVRELLRTLYDALSTGGGDGSKGLSRTQIANRFVSTLPREFVERLHVIPGSNGLRSLFEMLGSPPTIATSRGETETRYYIDRGIAGAAPPAEMQLNFSVPVFVQGERRFRVPAGEIGLTVMPDTVILLGGERHTVASIDMAASRVSAKASPASSLDVVIPVVSYRFQAPPPPMGATSSAPAAASVASGQMAPPWIALGERKDRGSARVMRYYASFERETIGKLTHAHDVAPLSAANTSRSSQRFSYQDSWRTARRTLQPVWRLQFPAMVGDNTPLDVREALALTLSVIVQDVARSLFPRWAHRLFAVAPLAAPLIERLRAASALGAPLWLGSQSAPPTEVDRLIGEIYPLLLVPAGTASGADAGMEVYLLEDSDFDLGVVQALHQLESRFFGEVLTYLRWLQVWQGGGSRYHCFGSDRPGVVLCHGRVLDLLKSVGWE